MWSMRVLVTMLLLVPALCTAFPTTAKRHRLSRFARKVNPRFQQARVVTSPVEPEPQAPQTHEVPRHEDRDQAQAATPEKHDADVADIETQAAFSGEKDIEKVAEEASQVQKQAETDADMARGVEVQSQEDVQRLSTFNVPSDSSVDAAALAVHDAAAKAENVAGEAGKLQERAEEFLEQAQQQADEAEQAELSLEGGSETGRENETEEKADVSSIKTLRTKAEIALDAVHAAGNETTNALNEAREAQKQLHSLVMEKAGPFTEAVTGLTPGEDVTTAGDCANAVQVHIHNEIGLPEIGDHKDFNLPDSEPEAAPELPPKRNAWKVEVMGSKKVHVNYKKLKPCDPGRSDTGSSSGEGADCGCPAKIAAAAVPQK